MMDSGEREETVQKEFSESQDGSGPILQRKTDKVYDFRPLELILLIFSLYSFGNMEKVHIPESCPHSSLTLAHKLSCLLEETWSGLGPCSLGDLATFLLAAISPFLLK